MTSKEIEKERQIFHSVEFEYCTEMENGEYLDYHTQIKFEGWLAAVEHCKYKKVNHA